MLINKMDVHPVILSNMAIRRTDSRWRRSGKIPITAIIINPTKKIGAKACADKAALHSPWIKRAIAVLNPQPGHCIPSDDLMGHCQPGSPIAASHTCSAATPTNISMVRRFWIRGPKTGINKNLVICDRTGSLSAFEINLCANVEVRTCFIYLLTSWDMYTSIHKKYKEFALQSFNFRSLK